VRRGPVLALIVCLALVASFGLAPGVQHGARHALSLVLSGDLPGLRDYLRGFGAWAPLVSVALMQVQAVLAPIPAFPLMYANGLVFGALWGGLLSWVSILVSAVLCFTLARRFGRPLVERLVSPHALAWSDRTLGQFGPFALFLGRLVPLTAFDLLSYAAGLTPMRLGTFCLATGLGMTPAIFLSAAAGATGVRSPWTLAGGLFTILAVAGLAALLRPALLRQVAARSTPRAAGAGTAASDGRATSPPAG
jgi:uncharacterized membrane protein YdjX (TVP38/TMEM64 family)